MCKALEELEEKGRIEEEEKENHKGEIKNKILLFKKLQREILWRRWNEMIL